MMKSVRQAATLAFAVLVAAPACPMSVARPGTAVPRVSISFMPAGFLYQPAQAFPSSAPSLPASQIPGAALPAAESLNAGVLGALISLELPAAPAPDSPQSALGGLRQMAAETPVGDQTVPEKHEAGAHQGNRLFDGAAMMGAMPSDREARATRRSLAGIADGSAKDGPIADDASNKAVLEDIKSATGAILEVFHGALTHQKREQDTPEKLRAALMEGLKSLKARLDAFPEEKQSATDREVLGFSRGHVLPALERAIGLKADTAKAYAQKVQGVMDQIFKAMEAASSIEEAARSLAGIANGPATAGPVKSKATKYFGETVSELKKLANEIYGVFARLAGDKADEIIAGYKKEVAKVEAAHLKNIAGVERYVDTREEMAFLARLRELTKGMVAMSIRQMEAAGKNGDVEEMAAKFASHMAAVDGILKSASKDEDLDGLIPRAFPRVTQRVYREKG